jgi:large subunit ribosomal protein L29
MKQSEINQMSSEELQNKLVEAQRSHAELKRMHGMSPLENPAQVTQARKTVARLKTAINSKR